jgi:hypothetical protein
MAVREGHECREFVCRDCGTPVIQIVPVHDNEQDICSTCLWLRGIEDDKDRTSLRSFLRKTGLFDGNDTKG